MTLTQPDAFLIPRSAVDGLTEMRPASAKLLLFLLTTVRWGQETPYFQPTVAAKIAGLTLVEVKAALADLTARGLIEHTTGMGYRIATERDTNRGNSRNKNETPAQVYNVIYIYNISRYTKNLSIRLRSGITDQLDTSLRHDKQKESMSSEMFVPNISSDTNETPKTWLERVGENPLLADLSVPLRVRVLAALGVLTSELTTPSSAVASNSGRGQGQTDPNLYRAQIKLIRALWKLLWGEGALPEPAAVATLISRYGGYKQGGGARLAMTMLECANIDTNPLGLLMAKAKSARVATDRTVSQYRDWTHEEASVAQRGQLDV